MHRNTCLYPTIYGIFLYLLNPSVPFLSGFKPMFLAPSASGPAHLQTIIPNLSSYWSGLSVHMWKKAVVYAFMSFINLCDANFWSSSTKNFECLH